MPKYLTEEKVFEIAKRVYGISSPSVEIKNQIRANPPMKVYGDVGFKSKFRYYEKKSPWDRK